MLTLLKMPFKWTNARLKPMYGMPQPTSYGQYGFSGYGGFPNQAPGAGAPGPGSPGMPQPTAVGAGLGLTAGAQQPGVDPNAAAGQAGQAQWGGADPNSYYSNYWGGKLIFRSIIDTCVLISVLGYYGQAGQQGGDAQMQGAP